MILTSIMMALAGSAPTDWLLVRGEPDQVLTLTYERIGDLYLGGESYEVIDPAESRQWIMAGLRSIPPSPPRTQKKRPNVDTW